MTLDWRGLAGVPDGVRLQLYDRIAGKVIDLRKQPSYTLTLPSERSRQLQIISSASGPKSITPGTRTPVAPR